MCIAVVARPGKVIAPEALEKGWRTNSDGGGFAYVHRDEVVIDKGYMDYKSFEKAYYKAAEKYGADSPMLIHMRIGTSGAKNGKNTHPFKINGGAMIHNGIMFSPTGNRAGTKDDLRSDTRVFAEDLHNILLLDHVKKAKEGIHKAIGRTNKLAFLYDNKEFVIVGEDLGFWFEGIWYSNVSCTGWPRPEDPRI